MSYPVYIAKSKINGKGSFAARNIKKGEVITQFGGKKLTEAEVDKLIETGHLREDDPFQIDENLYLVGPGKDYFINHCCDPNAGIKNLNKVVAIRDIKKDEEITFDYSTTTGIQKSESNFRNDEWVMPCNCGSRFCRGKISYILTVPKKTINKYLKLDIIPEFVRKDLEFAS